MPLSEIESGLPRFLREAESEEIVITYGEKPAGVLIGFATENDWFENRLENHPRFLRRVEKVRGSLRKGRDTRIKDIE